LRRVVPLTLGVGVVLFMTNADVIYVQAVFSKGETPLYAPAAMIGLALVTFTTPLAAVMFPKIVQSAARTEKTDAMRHALVTTALLSGGAALACTIFPQLPLRIIYFRNATFWISAPLVPWFAWCLLPLILANVLINNLLARQRFQIVPWLLAVAIGYGAVLGALKDRVVLFSAQDVVDPVALARRVETHADPVSRYIWDQLAPDQRQELKSINSNTPSNKLALTDVLNRVLKGPSIYDPQRFGNTPVPEEIDKLIQSHPEGKELLRLNRLLLHEAFPSELVPAIPKLFGGFKMVLGTLGTFSALLLVVAMWFTFAGRNLRAVGEPESSRRAVAP
jgi:hypothetical protein